MTITGREIYLHPVPSQPTDCVVVPLMGCGSSNSDGRHHSAGRRREAPLTIGPPQHVMIHIPRNRADEHGVPLQQVTRDIDAKTLLAALQHVSDYIAQRRQHISAIVVGGAVNTLLLKSRQATHDVDLFGSDVDNSARMVLDQAMHDAQQRFPGLGTDWMNTETQMWMPGPLHEELTAAARKQNVKVFDGAGLTLYAAPWAYAFSAKVSRILTGGAQARSYDLADAVTYIHAHIRANGNHPVPVATALQWARRFHHESTESVLRDRVDHEYRKRYGGRHAFV